MADLPSFYSLIGMVLAVSLAIILLSGIGLYVAFRMKETLREERGRWARTAKVALLIGLLFLAGGVFNFFAAGFNSTLGAEASIPVSSSFSVPLDNYGICTVIQSSDGTNSNSNSVTVTSSSATTLTSLSSCGKEGDPGTITVSAHRIPASYWALCFATTCTNPQATCGTSCTGPGASMYFVLYDSSGKVVATGFADERGFTFSGLVSGATYLVYPSDCDLCHSSTHDVLFNNWGDGSTTRPMPIVANGSSLDAWYTCTNGCGGG